MSSISCPGVNPISNNLLKDGWELSTSLIIARSPKFNSEAVYYHFFYFPVLSGMNLSLKLKSYSSLKRYFR
ncbi:MAG TPA: hypothetical protein PKE38_10050 [Ignavibacteriaceae bacterium]|nr:hypothetical protein [Ignavibacteriaceae bacterium]